MRIYLSGPIWQTTDGEAGSWRKYVKEQMPEHEYIDPVDMGFTDKDHTTRPEDIVEGDINIIESCDLLLANVWKPSIGTSMEIWHAFRQGIPVVIISTINHAWLIYAASAFCSSIDAAIAAVRHYPLDSKPVSRLLYGHPFTRQVLDDEDLLGSSSV